MMSLCDCEVKEQSVLVRGQLSILDPVDKVPQDENKTKSSHSTRSFLCDSCHQYWPDCEMESLQFRPGEDMLHSMFIFMLNTSIRRLIQ